MFTFFAAQTNPVDNGSLLAIYPVNAPPRACIATSFSRDGLLWSRPVNLRDSQSSFRTRDRSGAGRLEFRSGDHPAAGLVRAPYNPSIIHVYIHHSVKGMSMLGSAAPSLVRMYRLRAAELLNMTQTGLAELEAPASPGGV